jgi:hypothetical protein
MKALEFEAKLDPDASLKVPRDVAACIPKEEMLRVIVLMPEPQDDPEWRRLTREQFLRGYGQGDGVYDAL